MDKKYQLETTTDHHRIIELLEDKLYEHNAQKVNSDDGRLFSMIIRSEKNEIVAGIAGWTWAGASEITQLWVDEFVRKEGLGKILLTAAETEARSQNCRRILVRTFGFQAPAFYERHGYRPEHVVDDFPPGHRYHLLIKDLA
jgi:GNAT superfamily N-acetyltransferase